MDVTSSGLYSFMHFVIFGVEFSGFNTRKWVDQFLELILVSQSHPEFANVIVSEEVRKIM